MSNDLKKFVPINSFLLNAINFTYETLKKKNPFVKWSNYFNYYKGEVLVALYLAFYNNIPFLNIQDHQSNVSTINKMIDDIVDLLYTLINSELPKNIDQLKNIYIDLLKRLTDIYFLDIHEENIHGQYLLLIFGYLLGNDQLRQSCKEDNLTEPQEIQIKSLIASNLKKINFPEGVESQLWMGEKIGKGGFSIVYKGFYNEKEYAFKAFKQDVCSRNKFFSPENEIQLHWKASTTECDQIVKMLGIIDSVFSTPIIVLEFIDTDLLSLLSQNTVSNELKFKIAFDVIKALYYLHVVAHIFHRDVKLENILIANGSNAKLCDFGLATEFDNSDQVFTLMAGSFGYLAPEILNERYGLSAEIYSLAICLWELYHETTFWMELDPDYNIFNQKILNGERPDFDDAASHEFKKVVSWCWNHNPKERPTIEEIKDEFENNPNLFATANHSLQP